MNPNPDAAMTNSITAPFGIRPPNFRLPESARVGKVRLAVSNLATSLQFYSQIIGLEVQERSDTLAKLGPDRSDVLLELEELPGVKSIQSQTRLGLYHTAFLLPTRLAFSSFVEHLRLDGVRFGAADHLYSEAVYLSDPDGLSVEVYADRPRSEWIVEDGELVSAVDPISFDTLPPAVKWQHMPKGTTMGHVHFYVGDLEQAKNFYHFGLGLDITTWRVPGALFTSAGGYHHHVGLNVWIAPSPAASSTDARVLFWELMLPDQEALRRAQASLESLGHHASYGGDGVQIKDPWGITLALTVKAPEVG